jgi:hypothetical protein
MISQYRDKILICHKESGEILYKAKGIMKTRDEGPFSIGFCAFDQLKLSNRNRKQKRVNLACLSVKKIVL